MKKRVSDYVVEFFYKNGVDTLFTITGGYAMHLNDSFGIHGNYNIYYQHHEQACGYSAIGYSKTNSRPVIVCTTAGCAAFLTHPGRKTFYRQGNKCSTCYVTEKSAVFFVYRIFFGLFLAVIKKHFLT